MIEWLREKLGGYNVNIDGVYSSEIEFFLNWLESTGASPWVRVEDELPQCDKHLSQNLRQRYFLRTTRDTYVDAIFNRVRWGAINITHWMPIPPLS